jgi:hypothetical protein
MSPPENDNPRRVLARNGLKFDPAHTGVRGAQDHLASIVIRFVLPTVRHPLPRPGKACAVLSVIIRGVRGAEGGGRAERTTRRRLLASVFRSAAADLGGIRARGPAGLSEPCENHGCRIHI